MPARTTWPGAPVSGARGRGCSGLAAVVVVATVGQPVVTVTILVGLASVWHAFVARSLLRTVLSARGARRAHPRPAAGGPGTQMEDAT